MAKRNIGSGRPAPKAGYPASDRPSGIKPQPTRPKQDDYWEDERPAAAAADGGRPKRVYRQPSTASRRETFSTTFAKLWNDLFTTPVHLDSALSKLTPPIKTLLAQTIPVVLHRPSSTAEALGIGVAQGEPWSLAGPALSHWRPAQLIGEKLYDLLVQGGVTTNATLEDFPPHLLAEWQKDWGPATTLRLVAALGGPAPLSLRASRKFGATQLLQALTDGDRLPVKAELSNLSPWGVRLGGYAPILNTDLFASGAFEIQDEGSQVMSLFALWPELYAPLLSPVPAALPSKKPKATVEPPRTLPAKSVVDACAGAGGKSLALADAMGGRGRVFSYDTSAKKLQALTRRATRAGVNNIQTVTLTLGEEDQVVGKHQASAEIVLVDAPCSGWGVLRRNPDIKWRQGSDVLTRMPELQLRLLKLFSRLVAPGGRLVYGVCTFRKAETTEIVAQFAKENPEFRPVHGGYLGPGPTDGFFMQAFERV